MVRFIHEANVPSYTPEKHGRFALRKFNVHWVQNHREITVANDILIKYSSLYREPSTREPSSSGIKQIEDDDFSLSILVLRNYIYMQMLS